MSWVRCCAQLCFGIEKIVELTSKDNLASIGLLEKFGMTFENTVKMSEDDPGTALYS